MPEIQTCRNLRLLANGAALFDVAGQSKDPERDLSALSRAKAIEVMGQLGKLGDEGRRSILARLGADFVAGASLSQGQVNISWQAQHFRKVKYNLWQAQHFRTVKCRFCGRRSAFARSSAEFVAGAALSQGQVQNSWQAQHFRKVKFRIRGRCRTFARSSAKLMAGASLSQGQVQNSWQAQRFRRVK